MTARKPKSVWTKPVNADLAGLFRSLSKGVIHFSTGNWGKLAEEALSASGAISVESHPAERAWLLIRNALIKATFELVGEHATLLGQSVTQEDSDALSSSIDAELAETEFTVPPTFFEEPRKLDVLTALSRCVTSWLVGHGLSPPEATSMSARLPSYFVFALVDEWRVHPEKYQQIRDHLQTPFAKAEAKEQSWECYTAWLERQVEESMLGEMFSLRRLYRLPQHWWARVTG